MLAGRLLGRFDDRAVSGRESRRDLPCRHQDRKIPRNDLCDHAESFFDIDGQGVAVELGRIAFLGADGAGEIAKMIDRQRNIGERRFADRLAVVPCLGTGEQFQILLHAVGDL